MFFKKLIGNKIVQVNINKYRIKWHDGSCSKFQTAVKMGLYPFWRNDVVLEEFRIPGGLLRCDFLNLTKKISIESNGAQHDSFNAFFHGKRLKYLENIKRDVQKREWLEHHGFKCIEVYEKDVPDFSEKFFLEKFDVII